MCSVGFLEKFGGLGLVFAGLDVLWSYYEDMPECAVDA